MVYESVARDFVCKIKGVMMTSDRQLTYYDYWLTKEVLQADHAINIISNYFTFGRLFDSCDDYDHVRNSFRNELVHKMAHEDAKKIFAKRTVEATGYGKGGDWVEGKLNTYESDVMTVLNYSNRCYYN